ncbi:MAG: hypothetical protein HY577_01035 [Candidatus Nealsonbacteria bacterium]|nr:hypothetical protein [Candidatus Nealsonbacteria bacterium]
MDEKEELKDALARIKATFVLREGSLTLFLTAVIFLKVSGLIPFFTRANWAIIYLVIWLATSLIFRYLVQRQRTPSAINNLYFFYDILIEMPLISLIVYSAGGAEWLGGMFFLFPIVFTNIFFSRRRAVLICTAASLGYALLVLLPYFGLIPFHAYFPLGVNLYQNANYVLANLLFVISTFYLIGLVSNLTTGLLKKRTLELVKAKKDLETEQLALEVKVRSRTEELEQERASLEEKVKERTKELQKRIEDLETLQQLTVGRELRMVELKKEVEGYKEEINHLRAQLSDEKA